jgi:tetratricopeptide (TPR) repeat protein
MKRESHKHRLERCLKAIEDSPESASAYYNLGLTYTISGRVKSAEEAYLKAVELDPKMIQAWINLGGVRLMRWEFEGCRDANLEAVRLDNTLVIGHYNLGQAYLYLNDPENLVKCNKRVLELERDHPAAHYHLAVGYLAMDNHGAAERHLARAIELGHAPTQDFVKALEKAQRKKARNENVTLVEIIGAEGPDKKRED